MATTTTTIVGRTSLTLGVASIPCKTLNPKS